MSVIGLKRMCIMNNRKQQVESFLDTLTSKEMDNYIADKNINLEWISKFKRIKETKPESHHHRLVEEIARNGLDMNNSFYKLGSAYVIAFILNSFYDDKYKINDIKYYLKAIIDDDSEIKDYVYDIMKDF